MNKTFFGLRIKSNRIDKYENLGFPDGLLTTGIEFVGDEIFYYLSPYEKKYLWLVSDKEMAESALNEPSEDEDDATYYENPLFNEYNYGEDIETDDIEVVKIQFSSDANEFENKCFCYLEKDKKKNNEFSALGWEADDDIEEDMDAQPAFGTELSCPILIWESEENVSNWEKESISDLDDDFEGTMLSYKTLSD